jgi:hypothetical protein
VPASTVMRGTGCVAVTLRCRLVARDRFGANQRKREGNSECGTPIPEGLHLRFCDGLDARREIANTRDIQRRRTTWGAGAL